MCSLNAGGEIYALWREVEVARRMAAMVKGVVVATAGGMEGGKSLNRPLDDMLTIGHGNLMVVAVV